MYLSGILQDFGSLILGIDNIKWTPETLEKFRGKFCDSICPISKYKEISENCISKCNDSTVRKGYEEFRNEYKKRDDKNE